MYVGQIDSPEVRPAKVSRPKIDVPEFGLLEPCPHQVSPLKICPSQVRPLKVRLFEVDILQASIPEFGAGEGDILESNPLDIDLFSFFSLRRHPLQMPFQDPLQLSLCFHDYILTGGGKAG